MNEKFSLIGVGRGETGGRAYGEYCWCLYIMCILL